MEYWHAESLSRREWRWLCDVEWLAVHCGGVRSCQLRFCDKRGTSLRSPPGYMAFRCSLSKSDCFSILRSHIWKALLRRRAWLRLRELAATSGWRLCLQSGVKRSEEHTSELQSR